MSAIETVKEILKEKVDISNLKHSIITILRMNPFV